MNTILLAAGELNIKNMPNGLTDSQLMQNVNGKPAISWVLNDFLKKTNQKITIVLNSSNRDLLHFVTKIYNKNKRVEICIIEQSFSILDSCMAAIDYIKSKDYLDVNQALRVMLADTLILNADFISGDFVYVSNSNNFSEKWCLVETDGNDNIINYYNKNANLQADKYNAAIGRYEFSDFNIFETALKDCLLNNKCELSDLMTLYSFKKNKPLKAIDVKEKNWIDFGHVEGLSRAKKQLMESRSFNFIEVSTPIPLLTKKSTNKEKLKKEYLWYKNLPDNLKAVAPQIIGFEEKDDVSIIKMEYYGYSTLAEKFVYTSLSSSYWQSVMDSLFKLVEEFQKVPCPIQPAEISDHALIMYENKTLERIEQLKQQRYIWKKILNKDYVIINGKQFKNISLIKKHIKKYALDLALNVMPSFIHGDLCFNNILYDDRCGIVKLIDPRGEFGKFDTTYGDLRYDIAKLKHSFCGGYDHIIEGHFELKVEKNGDVTFDIFNIKSDDNEKLFNQFLVQYHFNPKEIDLIESLLFLSMTPLHNDSLNKQIALYAQGIMKINAYIETWEKNENLH